MTPRNDPGETRLTASAEKPREDTMTNATRRALQWIAVSALVALEVLRDWRKAR